MAKNKCKKTLSRIRYEQRRPTFSFRIYEELNKRLEAVKKAEGVSNTNILEAAVGLFEVKVRKEKEIRDQAYEKGWEKGITEAEEVYSVSYSCSVCRKKIVVTTDEEKRAIKTYMREHGWGHADCVKRRY